MREFLIFLVKIALAVVFMLVDLGIRHLAGFVLEPGGFLHKLLVLISDLAFVGAAIVIIITGAITIAIEFIVSTTRHLKRLKDEKG